MQHSSRKQLPPLLAEAELEIPKGWNALAFSLARDLEALALPAEYRIEKIFRIDEHIYVYSNSECLGASESALQKSVFQVIKRHSKLAYRSCMECGQSGKPIFDTDQWGVFCNQHIPVGGLDVHMRFEQIELEKLDRKTLQTQFSELPALELRDGWLPLIKFLMHELIAAGFTADHYKIAQVKEKFASLAFYVYSTDPDLRRQKLVHALIDAARNRSATMCEVCGEQASLWICAGWWSTLCTNHTPKGAKTPAEYFGKSGG